jgi:hypothetical protein
MSAVQIQGNASGTGTLTIAAPNTNTNRTLTLPDQTGTFMVNGPAFSAYASGADQSISNSTATKVLFVTEDFDTNNNFASSRFTPTVAGYYQINSFATSQNSSGVISRTIIYIYKNGTLSRRGGDISGLGFGVGISDVIYLNGSTDYVEIYFYITTTGSPVIGRGENNTFFSGSMVRGA